MGIRDIKRDARKRLHAGMAVQALYIPVSGHTPIPVTVRPHTKFGAAGRLNNDHQWAERAEAEPKLIFLASELPAPLRPKTGVVSVEPGEAYRIEAADPVDDAGFITAKVSLITAAEAASLPVPE
jgi:hypothetical protein